MDGEHKLENVNEDKYLGYIISIDGKNTKDIAAKTAKAIGIKNQIKNILEDMCLGPYYFEVSLILRNSLFLNGILTNIEASYGLSESEIGQLEKSDESLLRTILECPTSVPREMLYLELGVTPVRFIISSRRLMFYHYVINQPSESLIRKFYQLQCEKSVKNDWCRTIQSDLQMLNISESESDIRQMTKYYFKKLINTSIRKEAFKYLESIKNSHSKVAHITVWSVQNARLFSSQYNSNPAC